MLDTITIKVSDLYKFAKQMKDDGMDIVEITINDEDDPIPACLSFKARTEKGLPEDIGYEYIESIQG